jgi:hypothetical protein
MQFSWSRIVDRPVPQGRVAISALRGEPLRLHIPGMRGLHRMLVRIFLRRARISMIRDPFLIEMRQFLQLA